MPKATITIGGIRYDQNLLGGRETRAVGLLVTSACLRGIAVAMAKADLSRIVSILKSAEDGDDAKKLLLTLVDTADWKEIASVLGGVADGGATLLEMIGPDGLEVMTAHFAAQTTVHLPPDHQGAVGTFGVPLSNREDHWQGRWPQYLQWLAWGTRINGFFPDVGALVASSKRANGTAGEPPGEQAQAAPA